MRNDLVDSLRSRRAGIRTRWADLLRADRATTPLANPEALVHLIDWTLEEIERALATPVHRHRLGRGGGPVDCRHACDCQLNPLIAYFQVGQQALHEALVLSQASVAGLTAEERDIELQELNAVLQTVSRREIEAFCGICQQREPTGTAVHPVRAPL